MTKSKISVTLESDQVGEIEELVGETYENRSEAVRDLLEKGLRYEDIEQRAERLEREKAQILDQRDENQTLARYAETERAYREAPLADRLRWFVFGRDHD